MNKSKKPTVEMFYLYFIYMLQNMQPAVVMGNSLCNDLYEFGIKLFENYKCCGPQPKQNLQCSPCRGIFQISVAWKGWTPLF